MNYIILVVFIFINFLQGASKKEDTSKQRRDALMFEEDFQNGFQALERRETPNPWVELQPAGTPVRSVSPNEPVEPPALSYPHSPLSPVAPFDRYASPVFFNHLSYDRSTQPQSQNQEERCDARCCKCVCKLLELIGKIFAR